MSGIRHPRGNTLITQNYHVLSPQDVYHIPGCVCALDGHDGLFAVVHEEGRTKILHIDAGDIRTILERDNLIDIINISQYYRSGNFRYIFSTPKGVIFVFDESGERIKLPKRIPKNTIGIARNFFINYDGEVTKYSSGIIKRVTGYRHIDSDDLVGWTDDEVLNLSVRNPAELTKFYYRRHIDDVHVGDIDYDVIMILSEGIIHVKGLNLEGDKVIENHKLRGTWRSAPFYLSDDNQYAIDSNGILRDIRSAWINKNTFYKTNMYNSEDDIDPDMLYSIEPSLFERNIETDQSNIGKFHGMRVFTPKNVKSDRKR